jgi:hypothetical protein
LTVSEAEARSYDMDGILLESVPSIGLPTQRTADFTTSADETFLVDASGGAVTATLHVGRAGDEVTVINTGASGTVTITAPVGYTGGEDAALVTQWETGAFRCYQPGSWLST